MPVHSRGQSWDSPVSLNWKILKFKFLFTVQRDKQYILSILKASLVCLFWSVTLNNSNENFFPSPSWFHCVEKDQQPKNCLFPLRWVLLLIPHFKTSESMAFSICHAQIRPLTSNDSAIDTVTIPALPQYQDYIANISRQEGNTSSRELDDCNQKQCRRSLHHLKKQQLWIVNVNTFR